MGSDVRIGILGPLEVRIGFGEPVEVVGPRLRRGDQLRWIERGSFPVFQRQALLLTSRGRVDLAAGDPLGARQWYERALALALSSRDRPVIARAVELLADIALAGGDAEQAATLLGTTEVLRGMPEEADVDVVRMRAAARVALGEEGFVRGYRRGAARPRDQVLAGLSEEVPEEVRSAGGTPAGPAGRTPPQ